MDITTVLFDLDGTLLPMDQDKFINAYFTSLAKKLAPFGYEAKQLISAIWKGTATMVKNDGSRSNEEAFWATLASIFGEKVRNDAAVFEDFYQNEFQHIKSICGFNPAAVKAVRKIKNSNIRTVLATNPVFPTVATESRIKWAGLLPEDFELYTTYENSCHCKPNLAYYANIMHSLNVKAEECLMVGNDTQEDMIAQALGIKVFLITDCIINKDNTDISIYPHGTFDDLLKYIFD